MNLFNKLGIASAVVVLGLGGIQTQANAGTLYSDNMIQYGNFEEGFYDGEANKNINDISDQGKWRKVTSNNNVWKTNGWDDTNTNKSTLFELWDENFKDDNKITPSTYSDGTQVNLGRRHLELNLNDSTGTHTGRNNPNRTDAFGATISQEFTIQDGFSGQGLLSFDSWSRSEGAEAIVMLKRYNVETEKWEAVGDFTDSNKVNKYEQYKYRKPDEEQTKKGIEIENSVDSWGLNEFYVDDVNAGDKFKVSFTSLQDHSVNSLHIDNVSFTVEQEERKEVPEPTSMLGILAVGAFGTVSTLKRRKLKEI